MIARVFQANTPVELTGAESALVLVIIVCVGVVLWAFGRIGR